MRTYHGLPIAGLQVQLAKPLRLVKSSRYFLSPRQRVRVLPCNIIGGMPRVTKKDSYPLPRTEEVLKERTWQGAGL